ncbi:MAG: hypothetical protein LBE12_07485 [Planctomycetaceae bacterium]|nr:hypothetical protein [Planctomycetaceae bacterium]
MEHDYDIVLNSYGKKKLEDMIKSSIINSEKIIVYCIKDNTEKQYQSTDLIITEFLNSFTIQGRCHIFIKGVRFDMVPQIIIYCSQQNIYFYLLSGSASEGDKLIVAFMDMDKTASIVLPKGSLTKFR